LSARPAIPCDHPQRAVLNDEVHARPPESLAAPLRLQQTVEGLSVAAITYYVVGLIGYAGKGLRSAGAPLDADLATAASIPIVAFAVAMGVRAIRKRVTRVAS